LNDPSERLDLRENVNITGIERRIVSDVNFVGLRAVHMLERLALCQSSVSLWKGNAWARTRKDYDTENDRFAGTESMNKPIR
jgi:hypothetical protein